MAAPPVSIPSLDGVVLAAETKGSGPPLVFAHGLSAHRGHTLACLEPLADRFTLIAFDQRGHGASTAVTEERLYTPEKMAGDLGAVLDHLGVTRAVVGGESMGAAAAILFAMRRPDRVERLLLCAPAFGPEPNPDRERLRGFADEIEREGLDGFLRNSARRMRGAFGDDSPAPAYVGAMHRAHDPASLAAAFRAVAEWTLPEAPFLPPGVPSPLDVVAWDGDPMHPRALAERLVAATSGASLALLGSPFQVFEDPAAVGRAFAASLGSV